MSKDKKARKKLNETGFGFYNITLKHDKVEYNFRIGSGTQESFSEKNVLNFVALSYQKSCLNLLEQMKHYKKDNEKLAMLYLPAMFCFRHYLELELKLLYMDWHNEEYMLEHDLEKLLNDLKENCSNDFSCFNEPIKYVKNLEQMSNGKSYVEYLRYLIDTNFNCTEIVEIPMYEFDKIFNFIVNIERQTTIARINNLSSNK